MPIPIPRRNPYAIRRVAISAGGVNEVTIITFPDARAEEVITLAAETAMFILQEGSPAEGSAFNDDIAFPVPIGGFAEFPVSGWAGGQPRILLASATQGAIVRIMLAPPVK